MFIFVIDTESNIRKRGTQGSILGDVFDIPDATKRNGEIENNIQNNQDNRTKKNYQGVDDNRDDGSNERIN